MGLMGPNLARCGRRVIRALVGFYYPRIHVDHRERVPAKGPILLVANHPNSLKDAVILGIVARRPIRFLAKAPLFEVPLLGPLMHALGMLPAYRMQDEVGPATKNLDVFERAAGILAEGDAIGVFPEGKTHDKPSIEMVKSGASRIAMQAFDQGVRDLKVVPVGINYERKERFRSTVWVRIGTPVAIDDWVRDHEGDSKKATRPLTREIDRQLKDLAIHLNDTQKEPLLEALEQLLPPPREGAGDPVAAIRQRKRIADAMNYFQEADRGRADKIGQAIADLRGQAGNAGVRLDSPLLSSRGWSLLGRMIWDPLWIALGWLPALAGTIHHLIPFLCVRALASRVQTLGQTTVSLARLSLGIPFYAATYGLAAWWISDFFRPWVAWVWLLPMPLVGIWSLHYWRLAARTYKLWWQRVRALFKAPALGALRNARAALLLELRELQDAYARAFPLDPLPSPPEVNTGGAWVIRSLLATVVLIGAILVIVHVSQPAQLRDLQGGPRLSELTKEALARRLDEDERVLRDVLSAVAGLETRAQKISAEFASRERTYFNQDDNDLVQRLLREYMALRADLFRKIWFYQHYEEIRDEHNRLRGFLLGCTAASALFEASVKLVTRFNRSSETVAKLNEAVPEWSIPPGVYDNIRRNISDDQNYVLIQNSIRAYHSFRGKFREHKLLDEEPYRVFHESIKGSSEVAAEFSKARWKLDLVIAYDELEDMGKGVVYSAQSMIAAWIGDTKVRAPRDGRPLMDQGKLRKLFQNVKPGDVILERRNWYLSNAFLPGFWPHAALYTGTAEELKALGWDQDERIQRHWPSFIKGDPEGHEHVIIEALSEGVVFASLEHSVGSGDAVAILRPRLAEERIKEGMARAFSHFGKEYDFEFDFFGDDKIVCTELVFRTYSPEIDFPLLSMMGRKTMPAIELVRKFKRERGMPEAQFDFIGFLDGDEKTGVCEVCDEEEFVRTLERPGMTWLKGMVKLDAD